MLTETLAGIAGVDPFGMSEEDALTTLLFDGRTSELPAEAVQGDALWIESDSLECATGWRLEREGVCRGARCVPAPRGARWRDGDRFRLSDFARHLGQPIVRDRERGVVSIGPEAGSRLGSGEAPDFTLPDLAGELHSLSEYRGAKVLLLTWASW